MSQRFTFRRAAVLALGLVMSLAIAATAAPAVADELPMTCTTMGSFAFKFDVIEGPCTISNEGNPACSEYGLHTGIKYRVSGSPDHLVTLAGHEMNVSAATGNNVYAPGVGDEKTGFGRLAYHERAVKFYQMAPGEFWLVVEGRHEPSLMSILAKKGTNRAEACAIAGFGDMPRDVDPDPSDPNGGGTGSGCASSCGNFNPHQLIKQSEVLTFKGCSVQFTYDTTTGQVLDARLTGNSVDNCDFFTSNVSDLELTVNIPGGGTLGLGKFGEGYLSTGSDSCTTRVIAGKVYTWGSPCPN